MCVCVSCCRTNYSQYLFTKIFFFHLCARVFFSYWNPSAFLLPTDFEFNQIFTFLHIAISKQTIFPFSLTYSQFVSQAHANCECFFSLENFRVSHINLLTCIRTHRYIGYTRACAFVCVCLCERLKCSFLYHHLLPIDSYKMKKMWI